MNDNEKMLLLQLILEDIRGNWGWENSPRIPLAFKLANELDLQAHIEHIEDYDHSDGRHFRTDFENGGYYGMESRHNLEKTIRDKSEEFKELANEYLTYPENGFHDWKEYRNEEQSK